jgi:hypothetical protein
MVDALGMWLMATPYQNDLVVRSGVAIEANETDPEFFGVCSDRCEAKAPLLISRVGNDDVCEMEKASLRCGLID